MNRPKLLLCSTSVCPADFAGKATSSSAKFEVGLARALARRLPIAVLTRGVDHPADVSIPDGHPVLLQPAVDSWALNRLLARWPGVPVIAYGYDLATMVTLQRARRRGSKAFSVIFDSHEMAVRSFPFLRGRIVDFYFRGGFALAQRLDGWLVINDRFLKRNEIAIRHLSIPVGVDASKMVPPCPKDNLGPLRMLFAGTLNRDNGAHLIAEAIMKIDPSMVRLDVYGSGDEATIFADLAKRVDHVSFHERVGAHLLAKAMRNADVLLNLRNPFSPSSDYAFPSKLVDYLSSGTPVMSNFFPGLGDDLSRLVLPVGDFSAEALARAIRGLTRDDLTIERGRVAQAYLADNHDWPRIADATLDFLALY